MGLRPTEVDENGLGGRFRLPIYEPRPSLADLQGARELAVATAKQCFSTIRKTYQEACLEKSLERALKT